MHPRARSRLVVAVAPLCLATVVAACGDDDDGGGDAASFCAAVDARKEQLTRPQLETEEDVEAYLDLYRDVGELAPLAIESEWSDLTTNYETAATVDPADPESVERAKATAYSTEESAAAVAQWLRQNCNVRLGPVSTIVPHDDKTAQPTDTTTTTTIPG